MCLGSKPPHELKIRDKHPAHVAGFLLHRSIQSSIPKVLRGNGRVNTGVLLRDCMRSTLRSGRFMEIPKLLELLMKKQRLGGEVERRQAFCDVRRGPFLKDMGIYREVQARSQVDWS